MSGAKPLHARPGIFTYFFEDLKLIAREFGYNLVVHGSMNRDLDLIAIPWVDDPKDEIEMIKAFDMHLRGTRYSDGNEKTGYMFSVLPGGRKSYVINLNRGGEWNQYDDKQYYIDISVTPLLKKEV